MGSGAGGDLIRVAPLVRGWSLWADTECHGIQVLPVFVHQTGRKLRALDMAIHPDGPAVFREVKRQWNINKAERISYRRDMPARGVELANTALQIALGMAEKWNPELLEAGV